MKLVNKIFSLLTFKERKLMVLMMILMLLMALLDTVGVASIFPFISILSNPKLIDTNTQLVFIKKLFKIETIVNFQLFFGSLVLMAIIFSILFKAFITWMSNRFTYSLQFSLSKRLVKGILNQNYSWFLTKNSSDLSKSVLSEVDQVVAEAVSPLMNFTAQCILSFTLLSLLFIINPTLALSIFLFVFVVYAGFFFVFKNFILKIGQIRVKANQQRFKILAEAIGGIKEVKFRNLENHLLKIFELPSKQFSNNKGLSQIIAQIPRFFIEALVFSGLILFLLFRIKHEDGVLSALPVVSLYAYAGLKLMPAIQQAYSLFTTLKFTGPALDNLLNDFASLKKNDQYLISDVYEIHFNDEIKLINIKYKYPNSTKYAIDNLSMRIGKNSMIGIAGISGSGKSTLVDIILGLLSPESGKILVDNISLDLSNNKSWKNLIGYVPQNIFLNDESLKKNIAFGVPENEIDFEMVIRAAKISNLHEFIISELNEGYETNVGDRGVRLSGGQKQRIGIARALYNNPKVLILDEATSALDSLTEKSVMNAVHELSKNITIVIIAHRLSTLRNCNNIYIMEKGRIVDSGTFDELTKKNNLFKS
jgi:ABC-type bacteriocin/lantibiotic exporter with double-glycine peptidase domain